MTPDNHLANLFKNAYFKHFSLLLKESRLLLEKNSNNKQVNLCVYFSYFTRF